VGRGRVHGRAGKAAEEHCPSLGAAACSSSPSLKLALIEQLKGELIACQEIP